nr:hypothetical protein HK105_003282 [Polyrhizophydium stewartii]
MQGQIAELEIKLARSAAATRDAAAVDQECAALRRELASKQLAHEQISEKQRLLMDELSASNAERNRLADELQRVKKACVEESENLRKQSEALDQAVRVKTKMLEDQNETIRTLKQNLENKTREYQHIVQELEECRDEMDDLRHIDSESVKDLRAQIDALRTNADRYRAVAQEYRHDRDAFAVELEQVRARLRERNESIEKIEQEVARIQQHFQAKEGRIRAEQAGEIEAMKQKLQRIEAFERERLGMIETIANLRQDLATCKGVVETQEAEIKVLITELDSHRRRTHDRMSKLKAALDDG